MEDAEVMGAKLLLYGIREYGLGYDGFLYEMLGKAAYEAQGTASPQGTT